MASHPFAVAAPARRTGMVPFAAGGGCVLVGYIAAHEPAMALALVLGVIFLVVTFRDAAAGLAMFAFLFSLDHVPALGGGVTFSRLAGVVVALAWLTHVFTRRSDAQLLVRDRPVVAAGAAAFVVWSLASSLWAEDSAIAISSALRLSQGVILVFIVYSLLREPKHVRWLLSGYVAGALVAAAFAVPSTLASGGRLGGDTANPNELAGYMLPALMICAFALLGERRPLFRWGASGAGALLLFALLMTGSRGGLVGLLVALGAAIAAAGPRRVKVVAATLVIFGMGVVYYVAYAPEDQVDRLAATAEDRGTGRTDLWRVAAEIVRDQPLTGVGAGNFTVAESQYAASQVDIARVDLVLDKTKVVHNIYLSILSELGFVGLTFFLFLVLSALASTVHGIRRAAAINVDFQFLLRGFLVGLICLLAAYTFASAEYEKQLWLLLGTALTLAAVPPAVSSSDTSSP